ncbi:hypothetical protein CPLU01_14113 [Colletotrichum plurivorum]|uniref:Uncharacterized protein n=1 Tax=Colletotrichum plurivorum TaxID=2175906 RepID=A0A8H6JLL3_9PEZI|nr:hypothetical protein CPLU01_14113 [Colletotrichum plurivorum]
MQFKIALAFLFASIAAAAPPVTDANLLAREPQSGASCCSFIPGTCNCGCDSQGPCATFSDPNATC